MNLINTKQEAISKCDINLNANYMFTENIFDYAKSYLYINSSSTTMPYKLLLHILHFIQEGKTEIVALK
jgi:hypothetical protein